MTPIKVGPFLLLIYMAIIFGMFFGATAGFEADSAANATIEYDRDTGNLTMNGTTENMLESNETEKSELWNETFIDQDAVTEFESTYLEYEPIQELAEDLSDNMVNELIHITFGIVAGVGNPIANFIYKHQDDLDRDLTLMIIGIIAVLPLVFCFFMIILRVR